MSDTVFKRLNVSDAFTIPYTANKLWNVTASNFADHGIYFREAVNPGDKLKQNYNYSNLLYQSLLANYYPEFYPTYSHSTSSYSQTLYWNTDLNTSSYDGFERPGNGATTYKQFPTTSGSFAYVINIPNTLYSNKIVPLTFEMEVSGGKIYDDGEYNLRWSGSAVSGTLGNVISQSSYVGNLFYEQGLGVLTNIPLTINSFSWSNIPTTMSSAVIDNSFSTTPTWLLGGIINNKPYWYQVGSPTVRVAWNGTNRWVIQNSPYNAGFYLQSNVNDPNNNVPWSYTAGGLNSFTLLGTNNTNLTSQSLSLLTTSSINKIQFNNSYTIYEQNIVCRVKDYEFNASYNPTLTTGSVGFIYESSSTWITSSTVPYNYTGTYYTYPDNQVKDFATASYFSPYVSSIGFYNDSNQLLAVAQMSQPVPLSNATDITFIVKLDW